MEEGRTPLGKAGPFTRSGFATEATHWGGKLEREKEGRAALYDHGSGHAAIASVGKAVHARGLCGSAIWRMRAGMRVRRIATVASHESLSVVVSTIFSSRRRARYRSTHRRSTIQQHAAASRHDTRDAAGDLVWEQEQKTTHILDVLVQAADQGTVEGDPEDDQGEHAEHRHDDIQGAEGCQTSQRLLRSDRAVLAQSRREVCTIDTVRSIISGGGRGREPSSL